MYIVTGNEFTTEFQGFHKRGGFTVGETDDLLEAIRMAYAEVSGKAEDVYDVSVCVNVANPGDDGRPVMCSWRNASGPHPNVGVMFRRYPAPQFMEGGELLPALAVALIAELMGGEEAVEGNL